MTANQSFEMDAPAVFGRTATSTRHHLAECPHLVDRDWHPCSEEEVATYPLCTWSQDQLDGVGRSHPATLADAMRELGLPVGNERLVRELLAFVSYDELWLPYSRSYVALGFEGRGVAYFGKSYVWVRGHRTDLPNHTNTSHAGGRSVQYGDTCPRCFLAMPFSGACDDCS